MKTATRVRRRERRGASAVEFAFVAPILFTVVFGFIVMGQLVGAHQVLTHAARAGCRKAALTTTMNRDDVEDVVRSYLRRGTIPNAVANNAQIQVGVDGASNTDPLPSDLEAETLMTVSVSVPFSEVSWVPTGSIRFLGDLTLTGTATMERE